MKQMSCWSIITLALLLYFTVGAASSFHFPPTTAFMAYGSLRNDTAAPSSALYLETPQPLGYYTDTLGLSNELSDKWENLNSILKITGVRNDFQSAGTMQASLKSEWSDSLYDKKIPRDEQIELISHFEALGMREFVELSESSRVQNPGQQLIIIIASHPRMMWRQMQKLQQWAAPQGVLCKNVWLVASKQQRYERSDVLSLPGIEQYESIPEALTPEDSTSHSQAAIMAAFFKALFPPDTSYQFIHLDNKDTHHNMALLRYFTERQGSLSGYSSVLLACIQPSCPEAELIVRKFSPATSITLNKLHTQGEEIFANNEFINHWFVEYLDALRHLLDMDVLFTKRH